MSGFRRIALASAFSPRFLPLLAEARLLTEKMDGSFSILHVGERTPENEARFAEAFREAGIELPIHWLSLAGEEPSDALRRCVEQEEIDLVIAGAVERELEGRSFVGEVSRALMRKLPCSLLLFTNPSSEPKPLHSVAVVTDFSDLSREAVRAAMDLAGRCGAEKLHVLRIFTVFAQMRAKPTEFLSGGQSSREALAAEEARLEQFVAGCGPATVPVDFRCIEGTTGFAASDFAQDAGIDLLVIPTGPPGTEQIFPEHMEWLHRVIPTNLLLYRTPQPGAR